jgi:3-hydroxyacyl-CoA dehydrogenase
MSPESAGLRHVFFAGAPSREIDDLPKVRRCGHQSVGIIGAGTMGGGIDEPPPPASVTAEISREALDRTLSWREFRALGEKRPRPARQAQRLTPTLLRRSENGLAIEAVFENPTIAQKCSVR